MNSVYTKEEARRAQEALTRIWRDAIKTRRGTPEEERDFLYGEVTKRDDRIRVLTDRIERLQAVNRRLEIQLEAVADIASIG